MTRPIQDQPVEAERAQAKASAPALGGTPAASTNARPSPAAATALNSVCGLGGATVPSTAPLAVAPTTAAPVLGNNDEVPGNLGQRT
jgi:hypothetical protein